MWPILFDFGGYEIGTYGVLFGSVVLVGLWLARSLGRRDGMDERAVNDFGLGILFAGFVGAIGLGVIVALVSGYGVTAADFRNAGAIHGGLLASALTGVFLARHFKLPFGYLMDAYVPACALAQGVGRLGCFAAGCCFGTGSDLPWAVTFTNHRAHELGGVPLHVALHPVQVYDALAHFALFILLLVLHKKGLLKARLFGLWAILEGATRLLMETFRGDLGRGVWLDVSWLSTGRLTALTLIVVGAVFLKIQGTRHAHPG